MPRKKLFYFEKPHTAARLLFPGTIYNHPKGWFFIDRVILSCVLKAKSKMYNIIKEFKMSIFEALMMLGFGLAWPFNIYRSIKTKTAAGKSFLFMITIELAYICGMIHKVLYSFDLVFWLYVLNFLMVLTDIILMARNTRIDVYRKYRRQILEKRAAVQK